MIFSACGALNNSQFSKRKHLKGHFGKVREKYKTSNSNEQSTKNYIVSRADEDRSRTSDGNDTQGSNAEREAVREIASDGSCTEEEKDNKTVEAVEETELRNNTTSKHISDKEVTQADENEQLKERPSRAEINFAVFIIVLIGLIFWSGVIGLIVTLLLHLSSAIIPWLFYYSLFAAGIPLLAMIIMIL